MSTAENCWQYFDRLVRHSHSFHRNGRKDRKGAAIQDFSSFASFAVKAFG